MEKDCGGGNYGLEYDYLFLIGSKCSDSLRLCTNYFRPKSNIKIPRARGYPKNEIKYTTDCFFVFGDKDSDMNEEKRVIGCRIFFWLRRYSLRIGGFDR